MKIEYESRWLVENKFACPGTCTVNGKELVVCSGEKLELLYEPTRCTTNLTVSAFSVMKRTKLSSMENESKEKATPVVEKEKAPTTTEEKKPNETTEEKASNEKVEEPQKSTLFNVAEEKPVNPVQEKPANPAQVQPQLPRHVHK